MNKIIIANWKNHPDTLEEVRGLFKTEIEATQKYPNMQTVICPPTEFLEELSGAFNLGAQDVFWDQAPVNISHVLVGHSSRREAGETDEIINGKIKIALATGVVPVLFVGEREGEPREEILTAQLSKDLAGISPEEISKILFTYEPVWAISTNPNGHADTPENALGAIKFINSFLTNNYKLTTINYLYGGSVNESNVSGFLKHPEISGAVVGQASLDALKFSKILNIVNNVK